MRQIPIELPFEINFSSSESPDLFEAWLSEQPSLKLKEIATIFDWDVKDGKIENSEESFNNYLLKDSTMRWHLDGQYLKKLIQ